MAHHYTTPASKLAEEGVAGVILSGGPASVLADESPRPDPGVFQLDVPVLGICYGLQLMATMLGGKVGHSSRREYGRGLLTLDALDSPLLKGIPSDTRVWNSHGDKIEKLPGSRKLPLLKTLALQPLRTEIDFSLDYSFILRLFIVTMVEKSWKTLFWDLWMYQELDHVWLHR